MFRPLPLLLLAALAALLAASAAAPLAALAPMAPVPADASKALYYPTKVGAKWVYETSDGETTLVASEAVQNSGVRTLTIHKVVGEKLRPFEQVAVSAEGLAQVHGAEWAIDPPRCLLRLPHRDGNKWGRPTHLGKEMNTAYGPESVKVPAGSYMAIRVETEWWFNGVDDTVRATHWYAPGVGLVKRQVHGGYGEVLKSFTPGKN